MIVALQTLIFFRNSLVQTIDRVIQPYYNTLFPSTTSKESDEDEAEEQVFADFDDEKGVVFFPPVYSQRYAAVSDCLMDERWCGKLKKVVDMGYHDISFIKYLKEVPGVEKILAVDIETIPLRCSSDLLRCDNYNPKRENPLSVILLQGNAADPDYRLIGCDAVIAIEMIEHMLPQDLERLVHTVFGFIKPWVAIFTTPNGDFNVLFKSLESNGLRRLDHFFEWSREQFHDWCSNIVERYPQYTVTCKGVGPGPPGTLHLGCCSQLALFVSKHYHKQQDLNIDTLALVAGLPDSHKVNQILLRDQDDSENKIDNEGTSDGETPLWNNINWGENAPYWNQYYKIVRQYEYPFETKSEEQRILDTITEEIHRLMDLQDQNGSYTGRIDVPLEQIMRAVEHITQDIDKVKDLLEWNGYEIVDDMIIHTRLVSDDNILAQEDEDTSGNALTDVKPKKIFIL